MGSARVALWMIEQAQNRISSLYSWLRMGLILGVVSLMSSPVWAQAEGLRPPKAKEAPSSPKFILMAILLVLVGATVVAVTLKTKRDHQD